MAFTSPDCVACHAVKVSEHGIGSVDHVADQTATVETSIPASAAWTTTTASGKTCGGCHEMGLPTEHDRAYASTVGAGCAACHNGTLTGAGDKEASHTLTPPTGWTQTCATANWCHKVGSAQVRHANYAPAHVSTQVNCELGCHSLANLASLHTSATLVVAGWPDNGGVAKSCNVCHRKDFSPTSTDCQDASCHTASFTHPGDAAAHTATTTAPAINPSDACTACHETADIKTIHTALGCAVCHNNATRIPNLTTRTAECKTCHDLPTDTLSPKDYFPVDPNHSSGADATHTANESGFENGKACGTCHYLQM